MQNGTERQEAARETLRRALVAQSVAVQVAHHDTAAATGRKGPEAGEPASGQGPSEPRGWSVSDWEARPSGTEGREEI